MPKSLLDINERQVDEDQWMVGIFHKPEGDNPQHAFLLVEGFEYGQVIFRRYDLFVDEADNHKFIIHIKEESAYPVLAKGSLASLLKYEEIRGKCWPVVRSDAVRLHQYVLRQQNAPDNIYNILGREASSPKTGESLPSSLKEKLPAELSMPGHSCFTWARHALRQLNIPEIIEDLPKSTLDLIIAIPSLHLSDNTISDTKSTCAIL